MGKPRPTTPVVFPGFDDVIGIPGDWDLWDFAKAGAAAAVGGKAIVVGAEHISDAAKATELAGAISERRKAKGGTTVQRVMKVAGGEKATKAFRAAGDMLDDAGTKIGRSDPLAKIGKAADKGADMAKAGVRAGGDALKAGAKAAKPLGKAVKPAVKPLARVAKPIAGAGAIVELAEGDYTGAAAEVADAALLFAFPFGTAAVLGTMAVSTTYGLATGQSDYIGVGPTGLAERAITGD